jgi:two-component system, OmpR family, sensor histidine kinase CpxA
MGVKGSFSGMKSRFSLSTKVFLLASLNLVLLGLVFIVFMRVQLRLDFESFLQSPAQDRILAIGRQVALDLREAEASEWDGLLDRYSKEYKVEMRIVDGRVRQLAGPGQPLPPRIVEALHNSLHGRRGSGLLSLGSTSDPSLHWAGVRIPVTVAGEHRAGQGALVIASPSSLSGDLFFFDPKPWLAVAGAVVLISVLCWLPFVRGLTRSISRITSATARIEDGHFEVQLPAGRRDELGQLSSSINRMAARLTDFVQGQKRFLGDTAHELCSPLARMQVAVGILEQQAHPEQHPIVGDLRDDVQHMSTLVNEVLSFSKASLRPAETPLASVSIEETVAGVLDRESAGDTQITVDIEQGLRALAAPDLLARALANVLRNAVRYAGQAGPVRIAARAELDDVVIRISDHGPGLAEQDLEAVFQPFYRPAAARERETGGVGLGLAIVKTCIDSCQGQVFCRKGTPAGLEVEIRLKKA